MPGYTPEGLHKTLAEARQEAAAIRARCEQAVVQWRRASGRMLPVHPLDDQVDRGLEYVHGWRVAKDKWLPDDAVGREHGLDAEGRVRVCGSDLPVGELTARTVQANFPWHSRAQFRAGQVKACIQLSKVYSCRREAQWYVHPTSTNIV